MQLHGQSLIQWKAKIICHSGLDKLIENLNVHMQTWVYFQVWFVRYKFSLMFKTWLVLVLKSQDGIWNSGPKYTFMSLFIQVYKKPTKTG